MGAVLFIIGGYFIVLPVIAEVGMALAGLPHEKYRPVYKDACWFGIATIAASGVADAIHF